MTCPMASPTSGSRCAHRHIAGGGRPNGTQRLQLLTRFLGVTVFCVFVHAGSALQSPSDEPDFTNHQVSSSTKLDATQHHH